MKSARGFSLIELMITIAIIGILSAIALPAYNSSVVKANRRSAQTFMMEVAQKEQQYLLDNRAYVAAADLAAISSNLKVTAPAEVTRVYTVAITTGAAPPTFTVTATPIAGKKQASDGALTLDSAGAKTPTAKW